MVSIGIVIAVKYKIFDKVNIINLNFNKNQSVVRIYEYIYIYRSCTSVQYSVSLVNRNIEL